MPRHQTKDPALAGEAVVVGQPDNSASIALLEQWAKADATNDPAEIAKAGKDLSEFKASLNANRQADRPVFP
jgi:cytochrome c oxidase assembly factor CtaG